MAFSFGFETGIEPSAGGGLLDLATIPGLIAYVDPRGRPDGAYSPLIDQLGIALNPGRTPPPVSGEVFVANGTSHRFEYAAGTITGASLGQTPTFGIRVAPSTAVQEVGGLAGGTPRYFLYTSEAAYNTTATISWSGSTLWQTLVFIHDGTDFFARRDGVEVGRATIAPVDLPAVPFHFAWSAPAGLAGMMGAAVAIDRPLEGAELLALEAALTASAG